MLFAAMGGMPEDAYAFCADAISPDLRAANMLFMFCCFC